MEQYEKLLNEKGTQNLSSLYDYDMSYMFTYGHEMKWNRKNKNSCVRAEKIEGNMA